MRFVEWTMIVHSVRLRTVHFVYFVHRMLQMALLCGVKMRFLYTDFNQVSRVYKMYNHDNLLFLLLFFVVIAYCKLIYFQYA